MRRWGVPRRAGPQGADRRLRRAVPRRADPAAAGVAAGGRRVHRVPAPHPAEQRAREAEVRRAGQEFARGESALRPLNPELDQEILRRFARGDLAGFDEMSVDRLGAQGGSSIHEVRTWIAAHAALRTAGPYRTGSSFYQPVPEWIVGFAVTTALPDPTSR
ncbi:hypothetical protein ACFQV8_03675 [Pseudonocardia benzenivorans]